MGHPTVPCPRVCRGSVNGADGCRRVSLVPHSFPCLHSGQNSLSGRSLLLFRVWPVPVCREPLPSFPTPSGSALQPSPSLFSREGLGSLFREGLSPCPPVRLPPLSRAVRGRLADKRRLRFILSCLRSSQENGGEKTDFRPVMGEEGGVGGRRRRHGPKPLAGNSGLSLRSGVT